VSWIRKTKSDDAKTSIREMTELAASVPVADRPGMRERLTRHHSTRSFTAYFKTNFPLTGARFLAALDSSTPIVAAPTTSAQATPARATAAVSVPQAGRGAGATV
jgi:hypothetical protein